jgi:predicted transcriptional regulator of viral defense system
MPRPSSLSRAQTQIAAWFNEAGPSAYTEQELANILREKRHSWSLAASVRLADFVKFLERSTDMRVFRFKVEAYDRKADRYVWGTRSPYLIALSLKARSYLSHGTAARLHNLLKQKRGPLYLNVEQSPKPPPTGGLSQDSINRAFSREQRQSNYIFKCGALAVTMLSGKHTEQLAVEKMQGEHGEHLDVTNLERTLIDITVRPSYAGGIDNVVSAYKLARGRLSVDKMFTILNQLSYSYPYHQSIGFLMEVAGYANADLQKAREYPFEFDFHLVHGSKENLYSEAWRIFYPSRIKVRRRSNF